MAIQTVVDYVQVGGKVDVLVAFPAAAYQAPYGTPPTRTPAMGSYPSADNSAAYQYLWKLGELEDQVEPRYRNILGRVSGDRYGGSGGDAIEMQFFGQVAEIELQLSRWDKECYALLQRMGGLTYDATTGGANPNNAIRLTDMGALVMRDRSFRLLLRTVRDTYFIQNFPCCLLESDFGTNSGTKYSRLSMRVTAHRTPEGHWSDPSGVAGASVQGGSASLTIGVVMNADTRGIT
jgi:hypothetical protein